MVSTVSTSDFNLMVFRVTSLGRVTRNTISTVTTEDWKTYLMALRALLAVPNSPLSTFDTSLLDTHLRWMINASDAITNDQHGAEQIDQAVNDLKEICKMVQKYQGIETIPGGQLFHSLLIMEDLTDFLNIFRDPFQLAPFNWTSRTHSTYTWYGTADDIEAAINEFRHPVTVGTTLSEPTQGENNVADVSEGEINENGANVDDIADVQDPVEEQISAETDSLSGNEGYITPPRFAPQRNLSSPTTEDGTHSDVANRNSFQLLDDDDDENEGTETQTNDADNGDILNDADGDDDDDDNPNESQLRIELTEVDRIHQMYENIQQMLTAMERMKQSVWDKITQFERHALDNTKKELQDECDLLVENLTMNKEVFESSMDTRFETTWRSFRDKMLDDKREVMRRMEEIKVRLPLYEAIDFSAVKSENARLQSTVDDLKERIALLESKGSDDNIDAILQEKIRTMLQDNNLLDTIVQDNNNDGVDDVSKMEDSVAPPVTPERKKGDGSALLQAHTGIPLSAPLNEDQPLATQDEIVQEIEVAHGTQKPSSIVNSATHWQKFQKDNKKDYPSDRNVDKNDMADLQSKETAENEREDDQRITKEINNIFHPLPRYTRVRANINNLARDNLETIFCEEVRKKTKSRSSRLAKYDHTFYYVLRDSAGRKTPVTAEKILSIEPGSGDAASTYNPGYYRRKDASKKTDYAEDSDDLVNDDSDSDCSNFSAEFKRKPTSKLLPHEYIVKLYKMEDIVANWNTKPLQSDHSAADFYNALRTSVAKHNVRLLAYSDLTNPKDGLFIVSGLSSSQITHYEQKCSDFLYQLFDKGKHKFFASDFGRVHAILTTQRDTQSGIPVLEFILKNLGPDSFQSDSTYYNPRDRLQPPTMANLTFAEYVNALTEYFHKNSSTVTSLDLLQLIYHEIKNMTDFDKITKLLKEEIDRVLVLPANHQRVKDDFLLQNIVPTLLQCYGDDADGICNIKGPQVQVRFASPMVKPQMYAFKRSNNARATSTQKTSNLPAETMCKACLRYHNGETDEKCKHLERALPLYEYMQTLPKAVRDRLVTKCKQNGEQQHKYYLEKYHKREKLRQKINRLYETNVMHPDTFQHEREELLDAALRDDPYLDDYNVDPLTSYDPYTPETFLDKDDFYQNMDRM